MTSLWLLLLIHTIGEGILVEHVDFPSHIKTCLDARARATDVTKSVGADVIWKCVQLYTWRLYDNTVVEIAESDRKWIDTILSFPKLRTLRMRKELRLLTKEERDNYHKAINTLKSIPIGNLTRYDFIASWHSTVSIPVAHEGPGFLGWHRLYLIMYENALYDAVPGVTLPYFASFLDGAMSPADQTKSVIWSSLFFGNGNGRVNTGPFACWMTPSGPLYRDIGKEGQLFSYFGIETILQKNHTSDILPPKEDYWSNLERQHDAVHHWMGHVKGQINDLKLASQDPIFFNHHAFVDLVWEEFRQRQIKLGIDPSKDYPVDFNMKEQAPEKSSLFMNLTNLDSFSNFYTKYIYQYEAVPSCSLESPTCGSMFLECETSKEFPRCVSRRYDDFFEDDKGQICDDDKHGEKEKISYIGVNFPVKNMKFSLHDWIVIPIEIVYKRSLLSIKENSVGKTFINRLEYILSSFFGYQNSGSYPATYYTCRNAFENTETIYVHAYGINYFGENFKSVKVDNSLAKYVSTTSIAVKTTEFGLTVVFISARDSCGRVCRAYCKLNNVYRPCTGTIRITTQTLNQSSGADLHGTHKFPNDVDGINLGQSRIRFICDLKNDWPWKTPSNVIKKTQKLNQKDRYQEKRSEMVSIELDNGGNIKPGCKVGYGCTLLGHCYQCRDGETRACYRSNTLYAICVKKILVIHRCENGSIFQMSTKTCVKIVDKNINQVTTNKLGISIAKAESRNQGCIVSYGCVIQGTCQSCVDGRTDLCLGSKIMFSVCKGNRYLLKSCISGYEFDTSVKECIKTFKIPNVRLAEEH